LRSGRHATPRQPLVPFLGRPGSGEVKPDAPILVIKLGALGDMVQALAAFAQIRRAHPRAQITLLTTPPFADFAQRSGLFDAVETDGRPKGVLGHLRLFRRLRRAGYGRVYDLQTSGRTKNYILGFWPGSPQWSGISAGASHRQTRPDRDAMHNLDRMADQLHVAGAGPAYEPGQAPPPDLGWAIAAAREEGTPVAERFGLAPPFALLIPGASPVKPEKFWPAERYGALAEALAQAGLRVAVIGGPGEAALARAIIAASPQALDLTGKTSLTDLAGLAAEAALAVGNDSGPTHLVAYAGAPGLMLMSKVSDPDHCGPRARMRALREPDLADLDVRAVLAAIAAQLPR
jgi:ADP-heptose:LPS heptosyltransferase